MNPWYENLVKGCYSDHDVTCVDGPDCGSRDEHVERNYVTQALKKRVESSRRDVLEYEERIRAVYVLHESDGHGAGCGEIDCFPSCLECDEEYPCATIRALEGTLCVNMDLKEENKKLKKSLSDAGWAANMDRQGGA